MIHQLPLNACPSQKKSELKSASKAGLRNASRNSCDFDLESQRLWRGQELLLLNLKELT
jgi:aminoglycoside phosphotransferase